MSQGLVVSQSVPDDDPRGLSDEEELRRWGGAVDGLGDEVLYDQAEEAREMGLIRDIG